MLIGIILFTFSTVLATEGIVLKIDLEDNPKQIEYVEIKTSVFEFRIFPSGQIEKKIWGEIHRGKDHSEYWVFDSDEDEDFSFESMTPYLIFKD